MDDLAQRQLAAIAEFSAAARELNRSLWLRGGWAVDFILGRISRSHRDVDWFAESKDADALVDLLRQLGWTEVARAPREQQRDLVKGDLDFGIALIRLKDGQPFVGGGPYGGENWPATMISESRRCQLHGAEADVIGIEAQIEIKKMTPTWVPHLCRRQKDLTDIMLLKSALSG
ncbi:nucleotidyltransferase domain-containing protein [Nesterenkonia alkaliphila]|nr:hypothetical protein [Nesterenkonia alkaliphila]GFZ78090.1 hypothetical protein GCM10011359_02820 [Nesterenkonia alkaliphila]